MYSKKKVESFEDLRVWQKGIQLVKQVYVITNDGKLSRDFGLKDQLRRATCGLALCVSIPTNVAEGFERRSRKEYLNFLNIAKGSAGELRSLLRVALEVGYIEQSTYSQLNNQAMELSRMLFNQFNRLIGLPRLNLYPSYPSVMGYALRRLRGLGKGKWARGKGSIFSLFSLTFTQREAFSLSPFPQHSPFIHVGVESTLPLSPFVLSNRFLISRYKDGDSTVKW